MLQAVTQAGGAGSGVLYYFSPRWQESVEAVIMSNLQRPPDLSVGLSLNPKIFSVWTVYFFVTCLHCEMFPNVLEMSICNIKQYKNHCLFIFYL